MSSLFSQKPLQSLSTLSSAPSKPIPSAPFATKSAGTSTGSAHPNSAHSTQQLVISTKTHSISKNRSKEDNNPFVELPARKLYKPGSSTSYGSTTFMQRNRVHGGQQSTEAGTRAGIGAIARKPQRLVLTRVLPSSTVRNGLGDMAVAGNNTSSSGTLIQGVSATALPPKTTTTKGNVTTKTTTVTVPESGHYKDSDGFAIPSISRTMDDHTATEVCSGYTQKHPSTTPKGPPNTEYLEFIKKGLDMPSPARNLAMEFTSVAGNEQQLAGQMYGSAEVKKVQQKGLELKRGETEDQQVHECEESIPVDSTIMAFARKSIMQSASASPQSIFRQLNAGRTTTAASGFSRSHVKPHSSSTDIQGDSSNKATSMKASKQNGAGTTTTSDTQTAFTFVSTPTTTGSSVANGSSFANSTGLFAIPSIIPNLTKPTATAVVAPAVTDKRPVSSLASPSPHARPIFTRSVLDFSKPAEAQLQKFAARSTQATIIEKDSPAPPPVDIDMAEAGTDPSLNDSQSSPFDLRAALRMDSARSQYQLPSLVASFSPPSSPRKYRPTPYSVPSAHDREKLRSVRRMPQFKARPLNPKVFTSAGDLGVPRIQKQPLTVPVSPVFSSHSRTRTRKTRDAVLEGGMTKKDVGRSTASLRLKNMIKAGSEMKQVIIASTTASAFDTKSSVRAATDTWTVPLKVLGVDQTRSIPNLRSLSGPAIRQPMLPTRASGKQISARRPVTKPVPFKFATTELQRKRMQFQPTNDFLATATITGVRHGDLTGPSQALTLEDLYSDRSGPGPARTE
ncbi:hypothetical protein BGZ51_001376 [Haplosporangium sp. Z 767]|nr:hypothetical protein BGZ50_000671 [Haplosporangium sp. Z 11]KAF9194032.1 hypothetical protein BGZ51_001376 [Haplosporangium sp. Z 767]